MLGCEVRHTFFFIMNEKVFDIIVGLRDKRRSSHLFPDYVPYAQLLQFGLDKSGLQEELDKLILSGRIKIHRGINDNLLEILEENNSPNK